VYNPSLYYEGNISRWQKWDEAKVYKSALIFSLRIQSHTSVESDSYSRRHIKLQTSEQTHSSILTFPIRKTPSVPDDKMQSFSKRETCFLVYDLCLPHFLRNICYKWPINCGKLFELSHLLKMGCDVAPKVDKSHSVVKAKPSPSYYHSQSRSFCGRDSDLCREAGFVAVMLLTCLNNLSVLGFVTITI
jgi:hypothetical protein